MNKLVITVLVALAGCLDSIVDNPCEDGYTLTDEGECVILADTVVPPPVVLPPKEDDQPPTTNPPTVPPKAPPTTMPPVDITPALPDSLTPCPTCR